MIINSNLMKVRSLHQSFAPHSWCFGPRSVFFCKTNYQLAVYSNTSVCCSNYLRQEDGEGKHQKGRSDNHVDSYMCFRTVPGLSSDSRFYMSNQGHSFLPQHTRLYYVKRWPPRPSTSRSYFKIIQRRIAQFLSNLRTSKSVGIDKKRKKAAYQSSLRYRLTSFETETYVVMYTCFMIVILFMYAKV